MDSLMVLTLLSVCGSFFVLGDQASKFLIDHSHDQMIINVTTEMQVYHMEMDRLIDGNIMFSDGYALKTADSKQTQTIAGQATENGCRDGVGAAVRFSEITGFYQTSSTAVAVVDFNNHCVRLVDRPTGRTQSFAGACTEYGYADGSQALFDNPWSVIPDAKNQDKLLITDRNNKALRHIDLHTRIVSTLYKDGALDLPYGITQDVTSGDLFMTTDTAVYQLHYQTKQLILIAGSSTQTGYRDGDFSVTHFDYPRELLLLDNGSKLLVADSGNSRLRVLDRESNTTHSLCTETAGHTDGDSCSLSDPYSLMLSGNSLYIGEIQRIGKLSGTISATAARPILSTTTNPSAAAKTTLTSTPGAAHAPLTTSTQSSTTTPTTSQAPTGMVPCAQSKITKQLLPGENTVDVEIVPGHSLQLPTGEYNHKVTSQPDNCTIHISITEGIPTTADLASDCKDQNITVYTDARTNTAKIELFDGLTYSNVLEGEYTFESSTAQNNTCITTFLVISNSGSPGRFTCPKRQVALTSPENGLATFQLKLRDRDHILLLPPGRHPYIIKSADQTCNVTLDAEDYRMRHTLEFVADYTADCSVVSSTITWSLLKEVAKQKISIIEALCGAVCKKPGDETEPILSCSGADNLKIRWPTVFVFSAASDSADFLHVLDGRIRERGITLDVTVFGASPPVVYPNKAPNGGYVSVTQSATCINGLTYSDLEMKCV